MLGPDTKKCVLVIIVYHYLDIVFFIKNITNGFTGVKMESREMSKIVCFSNWYGKLAHL